MLKLIGYAFLIFVLFHFGIAQAILAIIANIALWGASI